MKSARIIIYFSMCVCAECIGENLTLWLLDALPFLEFKGNVFTSWLLGVRSGLAMCLVGEIFGGYLSL